MTTTETVARLAKTMRLAASRFQWHCAIPAMTLCAMYGRNAYVVATTVVDDPTLFVGTLGWPPPSERIQKDWKSW